VLLYDLQMTLRVAESASDGRLLIHSYYTQVEAFSVIGGLTNPIRKDGRGNVGDADVMSEFYQARQFRNLTIQKPVNRETMIVERLYEFALSFEFTFVVQSLSPSSRFRSLQLEARRARILEPPKRRARLESLVVKFTDAQIFYWHERDKRNAPAIVREEI